MNRYKKNICFKKRIFPFLIIASLFLICLSFSFIYCKNYKIDAKLKETYQNDWAFYNYGQKINGQKGIRGLDINILSAWKITKGDNNLTVAVIDTGVDSSCELLKSNILNGFDYYNKDSTIYDDSLYDYHGTYVSTTIKRVAPDISILPVKFMEGSSGNIDDAVSAIEFAIENNAKIINCSWNTMEDNKKLYNIIKNHPDILFVCSAGNTFQDLDKSVLYPCSYDLDNMITVMAVDNQGNAYEASGYGKNVVDIAAPGKNINVIIPEDTYVMVDGTSVAAAFVTGASSLILSTDPSLSPADIKDILIHTSHPIEKLETLCNAGGIIDVYSALQTCEKHN